MMAVPESLGSSPFDAHEIAGAALHLVLLGTEAVNVLRGGLGLEPLVLPVLEGKHVVDWAAQRWEEGLAHATKAAQDAQQAVTQALTAATSKTAAASEDAPTPQASGTADSPAGQSATTSATATTSAPVVATPTATAPSEPAPFNRNVAWSLIALAAATVLLRDLVLN